MTNSKHLLSIIILFAVISFGCGQYGGSSPNEYPGNQSNFNQRFPTVVKGFGISPDGFPETSENYADFLEEVSSFPNGGVFFNGAWRDDVVRGSDAGVPPQAAVAVMKQAEMFNFTPIISFGWRSDDQLFLRVPEETTNDWSNNETKVKFQAMVIEFSAAYHPPFLFLANENSFYYELNGEDYSRFVTFYDQTYNAIKAVSPDTQVGVIFNYEHLSGNGKFSGWTTPQWNALEAHDLNKIDVLGLTLYPWLGRSKAVEIPDSYLDELFARIGDTPLAITETGWPGFYVDDATLAWEASPEEQLAYVDKLGTILSGENVVMVNWLWLYPPGPSMGSRGEWVSFSSLSLYDLDGLRLPVYKTWEQFLIGMDEN